MVLVSSLEPTSSTRLALTSPLLPAYLRSPFFCTLSKSIEDKSTFDFCSSPRRMVGREVSSRSQVLSARKLQFESAKRAAWNCASHPILKASKLRVSSIMKEFKDPKRRKVLIAVSRVAGMGRRQHGPLRIEASLDLQPTNRGPGLGIPDGRRGKCPEDVEVIDLWRRSKMCLYSSHR